MKMYLNCYVKKIYEGNMWNFIVGTVHTNGQALLGAWPLAGIEKTKYKCHIDGLVQERCNSSALAMQLHLSYTNPSIYTQKHADIMDAS